MPAPAVEVRDGRTDSSAGRGELRKGTGGAFQSPVCLKRGRRWHSASPISYDRFLAIVHPPCILQVEKVWSAALSRPPHRGLDPSQPHTPSTVRDKQTPAPEPPVSTNFKPSPVPSDHQSRHTCEKEALRGVDEAACDAGISRNSNKQRVAVVWPLTHHKGSLYHQEPRAWT